MNGCAIYIFFPEQYLGPNPLLTKGYYFELIETNRHNNADLKKVIHIRLTEITAERSVLRMRRSSEDGKLKMNYSRWSLCTRVLYHVPNNIHGLDHFWHPVRGPRYDCTGPKYLFTLVSLKLGIRVQVGISIPSKI